MTTPQHTPGPWASRAKPLLKWSPRFKVWICAGRGVDSQAASPLWAYLIWRAAIAKAEGSAS